MVQKCRIILCETARIRNNQSPWNTAGSFVDFRQQIKPTQLWAVDYKIFQSLPINVPSLLNITNGVIDYTLYQS